MTAAAATVPQRLALLALAGAAALGFLAGGAIGVARDAPAAEQPAPAAAAAAPARQETPLGLALRRFNGVHLEQRALLANSLTSGEQSDLATELALDFVMTARELDRLGATPGTVALLEELAEAYDRLATAARIRDAAAYAAATREIGAAERRLRTILRATGPS